MMRSDKVARIERVLLSILVMLSSCAFSAGPTIGFTPRIGEPMPVSTALTDDNGTAVRIDRLLQKNPAILLFNYYRCANVCGIMIDKTFGALRALNLQSGSDVDVLIVSIDPRETAALAAAKKNAFAQRYGKHFVDGAHFLTGNAVALSIWQKSAGFSAHFDEQQNQYIHPTGLIFITAQARISAYEFGLPEAGELKKNMAIARRGDTRSITDTIVSICRHLVPLSNTRSTLILHSLRNSVAVISGLGLIAVIIHRKRRSPR